MAATSTCRGTRMACAATAATSRRPNPRDGSARARRISLPRCSATCRSTCRGSPRSAPASSASISAAAGSSPPGAARSQPPPPPSTGAPTMACSAWAATFPSTPVSTPPPPGSPARWRRRCFRSAPRPLELLARPLCSGADDAALGVVVDEAHGLHEGVGRGGADEAPALLLQVLRQRDRGRRGRGRLRLAERLRIRLVAPHEGGERAFAFGQLAGAPCVVDDGLDLAAVAHDARVLQQALHVALGEARHALDVEAVEGGAEVFALGEDGAPREAGLE